MLNSNPTKLCFYDNWSFNMVSKPGLGRGPRFKPLRYNLFSIC